MMQRVHGRELINVQWSANSSYEMMRTSDASNLFLASSSISGDLACSRMSEMKANWGGEIDLARVDEPYFYEKEAFLSPVKAMAWNPNQEGLLATGGGENDQIIRLFDMKNRIL